MSKLIHLLTHLLSALLALALIGCGGGGATANAPTASKLSFTIAWPARSRTVNAPGSALSCVLTLANANPNGGNFTFEIDRGSTVTAFTQTYTSPNSAVVGPTTETIRFYAASGATGAVVATASALVNVSSNGAGVDSISVATNVQSVSVASNQSVTVGSSQQLIFSAFDSSNNLVALAPGSATWNVASGSNFITVTPDGLATGISAGSPAVIATVDGKSSTATNVFVTATTSALSVTIAWPARSRSLNAPASALSCVFTLANANPSGGDFTFEIDRGPALTAFTQTYSSPSNAIAGPTTETVRFYAGAGGTGPVVATASALVTLSSNGTGVDSVSLANSIQSVSVLPNQTVVVGATQQLIFSAFDASNNLVAVSPGSAAWRVASGSSFMTLTPDGISAGVAAGSPTVVATVDGRSSSATSVSVNTLSSLLSVTIAWPARTRTLNAPSSALSCLLTLSNANPNGGDLTFEIERGSILTAFTQTYTSTNKALAGPTTETVNFYSGSGGTGSIVSTASAPVTVSSNGTGIDSVSLVNTIQHVTVASSQSVSVGVSKQLTFSAFDSSNNLVAVSPGSATWSVSTGSGFISLTLDGIATGVTAGSPTVVANVDGVVSAPTSITVSGSSNPTGTGLANSAWPKLHCDALSTGQGSGSGATGSAYWKFATGSLVDGSPTIGIDGTVYVGSWDNNLYAISPSGSLKWKFATGDKVGSTPAIGADGTIYFGSFDHNFYAVTPTGSLKWKFPTGWVINSSPTIGSDGTIYFGSTDKNFYAISPTGSLKWKYAAGDLLEGCPVIGSDGTLYFGCDDHNLYAVSSTGSLKWKFATGNYVSDPMVGPDGTVYLGSQDRNLYAVSPTGSLKWKFATDNQCDSVAVGADGTVYATDMSLYAITSSGSQKWKFTTGNQSLIVGAPSIGSDGTIYFGSGDHNIYSVSSSGSLKWSILAGDQVNSSPAIGADGTIYIGSADKNLYAIH